MLARVYYGEFYRDERSLEVARELGMELVDLSDLMRKPMPATP